MESTKKENSLVAGDDVRQMRDPLQDDDVEVGVEAPVLIQQSQADGVTDAGFCCKCINYYLKDYYLI